MAGDRQELRVRRPRLLEDAQRLGGIRSVISTLRQDLQNDAECTRHIVIVQPGGRRLSERTQLRLLRRVSLRGSHPRLVRRYGEGSCERREENGGARNGHPVAPRKLVGAISKVVALREHHFARQVARNIFVERVRSRVTLGYSLLQRFDYDRIEVALEDARELL